MELAAPVYERPLLEFLTTLEIFPADTGICRLVEQYTVTVVRGINVEVHGGRQVPRTVTVANSDMADVYKQGMVTERVVEAMQLLVQAEFPTVLGFQDLMSPVVDNLNKQFLAGETISQCFHVGRGRGHFVLCFAESKNLYYICSSNNKNVSREVKNRMARMFCAPGQPAIRVHGVRVEKQNADECSCRATTLMALLSSGVAIDIASRVKYPPIETQFTDLQQCLVEGQWLPRWAKNLEYHDKVGVAWSFRIQWPRKGRYCRSNNLCIHLHIILSRSLSNHLCIHLRTRVFDRATPYLHVMTLPI